MTIRVRRPHEKARGQAAGVRPEVPRSDLVRVGPYSPAVAVADLSEHVQQARGVFYPSAFGGDPDLQDRRSVTPPLPLVFDRAMGPGRGRLRSQSGQVTEDSST
jgi:hypothetical protein